MAIGTDKSIIRMIATALFSIVLSRGNKFLFLYGPSAFSAHFSL